MLEEFAFLKQLPAAPSGWQPLSGLIRSDLSGAMFERNMEIAITCYWMEGLKGKQNSITLDEQKALQGRWEKVFHDFYKTFVRDIFTIQCY